LVSTIFVLLFAQIGSAQRLTDEQRAELSQPLLDTVVFLEGFEIDDFVRDAYQCIWSGKLMVDVFNQTAIAFKINDTEKQEEMFPDGWRSYVFNVTGGVSDEMATFWDYCGMSIVDIYDYILDTITLYADEEKYHNYAVSLL
jgi:hypothetical protein